jgi:hypothetical protein
MMDRGSNRFVAEHGGFFVDVGESHLFRVELEDVTSYHVLYRSSNSIVLRAVSSNGEECAVKVTWSRYKRVAQARGYYCMEVCSKLRFVPSLHSSELYQFASTYVNIMVREYIPGVSASLVWGFMSKTERHRLADDVSSAIASIAAYTEQNFMHAQGRNLSTDDPVQFLNYRILLSMMLSELNKGDMRVISMETFQCTPVMCHQALSLDHIIIEEGRLTGIVGWSMSDYVPEIYDRMKYHFRASLESDEDLDWHKFLSSVRVSYTPPPAMYGAACMYYHYYRQVQTIPDWCRTSLDKLLKEVSDALLIPAMPKYDGFMHQTVMEEGDHGSRYRHNNRDSTISSSSSNPFTDTTTIAFSESEVSSLAEWENWQDTDTVLGILDSLSIA